MKNLRRKAQSLIEYGLILALVAVIAVTVLSKFGSTITSAGEKTNETVTNVSNNAVNTYCDNLTDEAQKAECKESAQKATEGE